MNEVFAWLPCRYESSVAMRAAAKEWDIVFRVLSPLGVLPLALLLWNMVILNDNNPNAGDTAI